MSNSMLVNNAGAEVDGSRSNNCAARAADP